MENAVDEIFVRGVGAMFGLVALSYMEKGNMAHGGSLVHEGRAGPLTRRRCGGRVERQARRASAWGWSDAEAWASCPPPPILQDHGDQAHGRSRAAHHAPHNPPYVSVPRGINMHGRSERSDSVKTSQNGTILKNRGNHDFYRLITQFTRFLAPDFRGKPCLKRYIVPPSPRSKYDGWRAYETTSRAASAWS